MATTKPPSGAESALRWQSRNSRKLLSRLELSAPQTKTPPAGGVRAILYGASIPVGRYLSINLYVPKKKIRREEQADNERFPDTDAGVA